MPLSNEARTTRTGIHLELIRLLESMGFEVEEERPFPPYSVDCYVEALHAAFEADGPQHSGQKDRARDDLLMAQYALPVVRLTAAALTGTEEYKFKMLARSALRSSWEPSADARRHYGGA
jgi:very-short-patch-repair endonuclease